jgi:hypothetical protein
MTTENQPTETPDSSDELDDLRHFQIMASAELDALRPLALQSAIRSAGYEPTSSAGRVLFELAKSEPQLAASPEALKRKATELGLSSNVAADPVPQPPAQSELTDPAYPPTHSRNTPGTVGHDSALREKGLRDPFRQAAERMLGLTTYEDEGPSVSQQAAQLVAAKWNPPEGTKRPAIGYVKPVNIPARTEADIQADKEEFLAHRKAADKKLRDLSRAAARSMVR